MGNSNQPEVFGSEQNRECLLLADLDHLACSIIDSSLYTVHGGPNEQYIMFRNSNCRALFFILANEVYLKFNDRHHPLLFLGSSLVEGARSLAARHKECTTSLGLVAAATTLDTWLSDLVPFGFWTGKRNCEGKRARREWLRDFANLSKHPIVGLSNVLKRFRELLAVTEKERIDTHEVHAALGQYRDKLMDLSLYHATALAEMLFDFFEAATLFTMELHGTRDGPALNSLFPWSVGFVPENRRALRPSTWHLLRLRS